MGLFGFGTKRRSVLDLSERLKQKKENLWDSVNEKKDSKQSSNLFSIFDSKTENLRDTDFDLDLSIERRRKLAKRILNLTTKIEDLSNQIYHLQQRVEVLEKKVNLRFEQN